MIFLFLNQNICCGYSKEPSQWDGSFEYPKHVKTDGKENIYNFTLTNFVGTDQNLDLALLDTSPCAFIIRLKHLLLCDNFRVQTYFLEILGLWLNLKNTHSNALAFVLGHLIGQGQKFATVYPAIYCQKYIDVINYVTFRWMKCSFMWISTFQYEIKLQKCIRIGMTIFKILIWGGISADIRWEILFDGSACASP